MHNQNGRHYGVDTFRRYEGGGLGAEIRGDVILMGSLGFMKLMRVHMPEGARVKQAVYLSVNGELAAVFALSYAPATNVKACLQALARCTGLTPILATRDFMITPQFLKHRYKLSPDRIEFPTVEERARLSSPAAVQEPRQGALLARTGFSCFSMAVAGARAARSAAIAAIAVTYGGKRDGTSGAVFPDIHRLDAGGVGMESAFVHGFVADSRALDHIHDSQTLIMRRSCEKMGQILSVCTR